VKNVVLKSYINDPVYYTTVLIVVAHDAVKAYARYAKRFNDLNPRDSFTSLAVSEEGHYGLFFHADSVGHESIGHEIKNLVDLVMENIGARKRTETIQVLSEPEAYLTGYYHKRLYALLKKHKIRLK
jgi:hypothetical protein